jgi:hypothetical protein
MNQLPRRQWLLLAPALLASLTARAQRHDGNDDGFFQVVRATYGTEQRSVDVTERVLQLVTRDQQFRVSNDTFRTDPAPRKTKTLWIEVQSRYGQRRTFTFREGDMVEGTQFRGFAAGGPGRPQPGGYATNGWERLEQATFGTDRRSMDVTQRVRQLLQQGTAFHVDPQVMGGDPAYGQTKYLQIRLRGQGGRPMSFPENTWVDPQQILGGYPR